MQTIKYNCTALIRSVVVVVSGGNLDDDRH